MAACSTVFNWLTLQHIGIASEQGGGVKSTSLTANKLNWEKRGKGGKSKEKREKKGKIRKKKTLLPNLKNWVPYIPLPYDI